MRLAFHPSYDNVVRTLKRGGDILANGRARDTIQVKFLLPALMCELPKARHENTVGQSREVELLIFHKRRLSIRGSMQIHFI